jgi:putative membrane protein
MAQRLYRFMTILMMPAVALGLILWLYYGVGRGSVWMHIKVLLVLVIIAYHLQCKRLLKNFLEKNKSGYSAHISHVGDSRIYFFSKKAAKF